MYVPPRLKCKVFNTNLIHVPADIKSRIAFFIQLRFATTILYSTYDTQLILIYVFFSVSHIKLHFHYGQWQVKYSKPDWIWQQPETYSKDFPSKMKDFRSDKNGQKHKNTLVTRCRRLASISLSLFPFSSTMLLKLVIVKCWSIESCHVEKHCFLKGKFGVQPNFKPPSLKTGI